MIWIPIIDKLFAKISYGWVKKSELADFSFKRFGFIASPFPLSLCGGAVLLLKDLDWIHVKTMYPPGYHHNGFMVRQLIHLGT